MAQAKVRVLDAGRARMPWRTRLAIGLAAAATFLAIGVGSASAHHGWTGYDSNTLLILGGRITEVDYQNPHVQIVLEVPAEPEEDGTIEDGPEYLLVVLAPPSRSESRGMPRSMFQPEAEALVEGYLHRTQDRELRAERITIGGISVELR
jgi:hypothetical protein